MDTRTPRTSNGGSPRGFFDDEPALSTLKVPSDPAQVIVNHASFRVQLAASTPVSKSPCTHRNSSAHQDTRRGSAFENTASMPAASAKRRAPVVWSGRAQPGDSSAAKLLDAVRTDEAQGRSELGESAEAAVGTVTQVLSRVEEDAAPSSPHLPGRATVVGPPRSPRPPEMAPPELLRGMRPVRGAFDEDEAEKGDAEEAGDARDADLAAGGGDESATGALGTVAGAVGGAEGTGSNGGLGAAGVGDVGGAAAAQRRRAYYPGRRMNLGVVLLPLRVFLGFISVYAGMGKLCDPVYFDGGERGSMVTWLRQLDPWTVASPLRDFALEHPVGSGLTVAFLQVIVGVLTMCGLWQRAAAALGALLSAALLMTVSWSTVPAYDAPDIIYLAAWSPLIIAGAPVYSADARLAGEAWRKLGPRAGLRDLRGRVLRRGAVMVTVVVGLSLLIGSLLGGAVRSSPSSTVPEPDEPPANQLPGSPLPKDPGERTAGGQVTQGSGTPGTPSTQGGTHNRHSADPSTSASTGQQRRKSGGSTVPDQGRTAQQAPQRSAPPAQRPAPGDPGQPSAGGTTTGADAGNSDAGGTTGSDSGSGSGGSSSSGGSGALGGLLH